MKKRTKILLLLLLLLPCILFAETKGQESTVVSLDLDVEKFNLGFADSEANAVSFVKVKDGYEFRINSSVSQDNTEDMEVKTSQEGSMYFFYSAAMKRATNFRLTAKILSPLTQQVAGEDEIEDPDTIAYEAVITGNIDSAASFKDGTWVKSGVTKTITSSDTEASEILPNMRGDAKSPYTVVYASAFKIDLRVTEENLGAKKAAVYKSQIQFAVETV